VKALGFVEQWDLLDGQALQREEARDWIRGLETACNPTAADVNSQRSINGCSRERNGEVVSCLQKPCTDDAWKLKRQVDDYFKKEAARRSLRPGVELHSLVQPPPWEEPLLKIGGRAVGRLTRQGVLGCRCEYYKMGKVQIKMCHHSCEPGSRSKMVAQHDREKWVAMGEPATISEMTREAFIQFLNEDSI
jgi:hypothetical protein